MAARFCREINAREFDPNFTGKCLHFGAVAKTKKKSFVRQNFLHRRRNPVLAEWRSWSLVGWASSRDDDLSLDNKSSTWASSSSCFDDIFVCGQRLFKYHFPRWVYFELISSRSWSSRYGKTVTYRLTIGKKMIVPGPFFLEISQPARHADSARTFLRCVLHSEGENWLLPFLTSRCFERRCLAESAGKTFYINWRSNAGLIKCQSPSEILNRTFR